MSRTKKFIIFTLVLVALGLVLIGSYFAKIKANLAHDPRDNSQCLTNTRLFDYADKLTDSEKSTLNDEITALEELVGMDVVIVTIDENTDLSEIGAASAGSTQQIAENMCDYFRFGWEEWPEGTYLDGYDASTSIVVVTNWDPNSPYENAYMCTSGKARERISDSKAVDIMDYGCEILRNDPLGGFERILARTEKSMKSGGHAIPFLSPFLCFVAALAIAIVFFVYNYSKKAGKDTTSASTYSKGNAKVLDRRDIFIRKEVTSVKIETSSGESSGGGGSSGGHGGGGSHF